MCPVPSKTKSPTNYDEILTKLYSKYNITKAKPKKQRFKSAEFWSDRSTLHNENSHRVQPSTEPSSIHDPFVQKDYESIPTTFPDHDSKAEGISSW